MSEGHKAAPLAVIGLLALACNVDPEGTGTSFTPAGDSTTTTTSSSSDGGGPVPSDSSSTGGSTSTTTGTDTGATGDSTGEETGVNMVECRGMFPLMWQNGEDCMTELPFEPQQYGYGTAMLRQTLCVHPGGPFLYMLFGEDKAMLLDTGSGDITIAPTVLSIVDDWLAVTGKPGIELVVTNTHEDDAHYGGNFQFESTEFATIVGPTKADMEAYFGITDWTTGSVEFDLGGRILDIIPTTGHHPAQIVVYDRMTGVLFTGDLLLPGRLIITDFDAYVSDIERLVQFTENRDVCHILGSHIDMTIMPGQAYDFGEMVHLAEHGLPLTRDHLLELHEALQAMVNGPGPLTEIHDEFIIMPL